ncbi:unnamed protein product [Acanthosepion pharaonis]|uniref:Uncharacterized protein n=1 Tax=Acanthosepion pharaonis TaxID=158019 RepID=A0A812DTX3_ACAPH|nr:unnamed protein product [Sepia pharaonis]
MVLLSLLVSISLLNFFDCYFRFIFASFHHYSLPPFSPTFLTSSLPSPQISLPTLISSGFLVIPLHLIDSVSHILFSGFLLFIFFLLKFPVYSVIESSQYSFICQSFFTSCCILFRSFYASLFPVNFYIPPLPPPLPLPLPPPSLFPLPSLPLPLPSLFPSPSSPPLPFPLPSFFQFHKSLRFHFDWFLTTFSKLTYTIFFQKVKKN